MILDLKNGQFLIYFLSFKIILTFSINYNTMFTSFRLLILLLIYKLQCDTIINSKVFKF